MNYLTRRSLLVAGVVIVFAAILFADLPLTLNQRSVAIAQAEHALCVELGEKVAALNSTIAQIEELRSQRQILAAEIAAEFADPNDIPQGLIDFVSLAKIQNHNQNASILQGILDIIGASYATE